VGVDLSLFDFFYQLVVLIVPPIYHDGRRWRERRCVLFCVSEWRVRVWFTVWCVLFVRCVRYQRGNLDLLKWTDFCSVG
jgi:hypothetical protein